MSRLKRGLPLGWLFAMGSLFALGCVVSEGQIGQRAPATNAPDNVEPMPEAVPPTACQRCTVEEPDAVLACLTDGRSAFECAALIQACDIICAVEPCAACHEAQEVFAQACALSGHPDCDPALIDLEFGCLDACGEIDECGDCVESAARGIADCLLSGGSADCLSPAQRQFEDCDCPPDPICEQCLADAATFDCVGPDCAARVATQLGACVVACRPERCESCESAGRLTAEICAQARAPICSPLGDVVTQRCEADCRGDVCGACALDAEEAFLICTINGAQDCGLIWEDVMQTCDPQCVEDVCGVCLGAVNAGLMDCGAAPECAVLDAQLHSICLGVCQSPPCADCAMPWVIEAVDCAQSQPPEDCLESLSAVEACAPVCAADVECELCGVEADLQYALCRLEQPEANCAELHTVLLATCACPPPPCEVRVSIARQRCIEQFEPLTCAMLDPFISDACVRP